MIYLIIGLPLTILFFTNLRSLTISYFKFMCNFFLLLLLRIFKSNTKYFNLISKKMNIDNKDQNIYKNSLTQSTIKKVMKQQSYNKVDENQSLFENLIEIIVLSYLNANKFYGLSIFLSLVLNFVYLTFGVVYVSIYFKISVIDSFYLLVIMLCKIDLNLFELKFDLIRTYLEFFLVITYIFIGMCLISLTIERITTEMTKEFNEKTRALISKIIFTFKRFGFVLMIDNLDIVCNNSENFSNYKSSEQNDELKIIDSTMKRKLSHTKTDNKQIKNMQTQITTMLCSKSV